MANLVPTISNFNDFIAGLTAAKQDIAGGSGGDNFLSVDKQTGALTFGMARTPLPPNRRKYVIPLHEMTYGYLITSADKKVLERVMIPVSTGPRPIPPGGKYGTYEQGGPRNATEINLISVDEPGFRLNFRAWGPSNEFVIGNLLQTAIAHVHSADGKRGYIHPVLEIKAGSYKQKAYGNIHTLAYEIYDWLHKDGELLLSQAADAKVAKLEAVETGDQDGVVTDAEPDDDDLTELERDLMRL